MGLDIQGALLRTSLYKYECRYVFYATWYSMEFFEMRKILFSNHVHRAHYTASLHTMSVAYRQTACDNPNDFKHMK